MKTPKTANECLLEYGINTMELNDEFNCQLLAAMNEYASQFYSEEQLKNGLRLLSQLLIIRSGTLETKIDQVIENLKAAKQPEEL